MCWAWDGGRRLGCFKTLGSAAWPNVVWPGVEQPSSTGGGQVGKEQLARELRIGADLATMHLPWRNVWPSGGRSNCATSSRSKVVSIHARSGS